MASSNTGNWRGRELLIRLIDDLQEDQIETAAACLLYLRDSGTREGSWE